MNYRLFVAHYQEEMQSFEVLLPDEITGELITRWIRTYAEVRICIDCQNVSGFTHDHCEWLRANVEGIVCFRGASACFLRFQDALAFMVYLHERT